MSNAVRTPDRILETVIEPGGVAKDYWRDLWRFRELFQVLAWRDISIRYKQTVIGVSWGVIRPLLTMVIFTVLFGKIAKLPSEGDAPYALLVLAGMLPWTFFSTALNDASNSLINNTNLIGKIYFPRLIIPASAVVVSFVDLLISFIILVATLAFYQFLPSWHVVFLPAFILMAFLAALGPALWVTAINVKYRDLRYIISFIVQFGVYVSPVGFSSSIVPEKWLLLYSANPMVVVIDGFRWCLLGGNSRIYWPGFALSVFVIAFFLWLGLRRFRKMEQTFADLI